ncbi:MAG: hypothetical protein ABSG70_04550 [Terriglobales bacterium]
MLKIDPEASGKPDRGSGEEEKLVQKKRYVKPSFSYETVFETQALACGKISGTQFQCHFNRKTS